MDGNRLLTGDFQVSFPQVFKAVAFENSDPKFSAEMLFDREDPTVKALAELVQSTMIAKWGKKPTGFQSPIRLGDQDYGKGSKAEKYAEYVGRVYCKALARANHPPKVIDRNKSEIMNETEIYPGSICRAVVGAWAYDNKFGKGVSLTLEILQKLADATPFAGGSSAKVEDLPDLPQEDPAVSVGSVDEAFDPLNF